MGQILHGTATTTHRIRKEIQASMESIKKLAEKYNINVKTVRKWKNRDFVEDLKCGKKKGQGSVLEGIAEQIVVEVRRKTLLPLDDLLLVLKPVIPELTRSNLHRCLQRHKVSRIKDLLPQDEQKQRKTKKFKEYKPGYLHIDTSEIRISKKRYYLFVAIDRATRYAYVEVYDNKTSATATMFLKNALQQYPIKIEKILTDNGVEFCYNVLPENKKPKNKIHPFVKLCRERGIEHRTTLVKHPWTNGMVEAMNKKIKEHTSKKYHYEDIDQFKKHLYFYVLNYN
ncbi:MAG: IS481 family transposase [Vicingaceae bacterium]|nr:MAG: IS481 family transposase [Vicingaceae bacterium]